ncbi:MAG: 50S ribosomal protein L5 [Chloroflexi bacterium]|nr:MAG: 50S ribosomal protein L5 [Chloroflexota bacterium]
MAATATDIPRLQARYRENAAQVLMTEFGYSNVMEIPRVTKVAVNIGLGEALENANAIESATKDLLAITGQRPYVRRAKKAISNFKLRENNPIGLSLTLRGDRMWEFLDRLINAALPRTRDFHGVTADAFDGRGNYSLGLTEQVIFPELSFDQVDRVRGMQINVVTTAKTDAEGRRLLELLGMPFVKKQ